MILMYHVYTLRIIHLQPCNKIATHGIAQICITLTTTRSSSVICCWLGTKEAENDVRDNSCLTDNNNVNVRQLQL